MTENLFNINKNEKREIECLKTYTINYVST